MTLIMFKAEEDLRTFLQIARQLDYLDMEEDMRTYGQRMLKEGRAEGHQQGLNEGLQKGFQKGRSEGRVEGLQDSLKRQLKKKFGLAPEESVKINQVKDPALLEAALDEIITTDEKQQVLEKLGL